ncbi:HMA2 domain-containing protein [Halochromatium salexigens]|uniref:HMA2 domain-containing protein n=1 Tax=Halochromatium salexigens TaxID=49447 RepID=UPI003B833CE6
MRVHHRIAGRLRVFIPLLRGDPALTQRLVDALEANADIRSVRANPTCGSLIIRHRLDALSTDQLEAYVSALMEPWLVSQDHQRSVHQGPAPADSQRRSQGCSPVNMQGSTHRSDQSSAQWLATVPSSRRHETERGRQRSTLIRQPLTWPLADLSRDRTEMNPGTLAQVSKTGPSKTKLTAVSGIDRALFSVPDRCWLCDLNQYLMRAMLRFSLRCWWRDRRRALARRFAVLKTIRLEHLSRHLRS